MGLRTSFDVGGAMVVHHFERLSRPQQRKEGPTVVKRREAEC